MHLGPKRHSEGWLCPRMPPESAFLRSEHTGPGIERLAQVLTNHGCFVKPCSQVLRTLMPQNEGLGLSHTPHFLILRFSSLVCPLSPVIHNVNPLLQGVSSVHELSTGLKLHSTEIKQVLIHAPSFVRTLEYLFLIYKSIRLIPLFFLLN